VSIDTALAVIEVQQAHVLVDRLGAVGGARLAVDVGDMRLDRAFGDHEPLPCRPSVHHPQRYSQYARVNDDHVLPERNRQQP
jgi:hypothetical protein